MAVARRPIYSPLREEIPACMGELPDELQRVVQILLAASDMQLQVALGMVQEKRPSVWRALTGRRQSVQSTVPPRGPRTTDKVKRMDSDDVGHDDGNFHICCPDPGIEGRPLVQFHTFTYYCLELESCLNIDIMRIRDLSATSEVRFKTHDLTAKAGQDYTATDTRVTFEPGEELKTVSVEVNNTDMWNTTLELGLQLYAGEDGLKNASLGRYLWRATGKIIDDDFFPSKEVEDEIETNLAKKEDKASFAMFIEYVKFNLHNATIRSRAKRHLAVDTMHNLYEFVGLFANVYLLDYILKKYHNVDELWFFHDRTESLFALVAVLLVPFGLLHMLDHWRANNCGVGGTSRLTLQSALMRKYFNFSEATRQDYHAGDLVMALTRDAPSLVSDGFVGTIHMVKEFGDLSLMLMYQFLAPWVFNKRFSPFGLIPFFLFPICMAAFVQIRRDKTTTLLDARNDQQDIFVERVEECVHLYRLVASYHQQSKFEKRFEKAIADFNKANKQAGVFVKNNKYFARWLSMLLICGYMLVGGMQVVEGHETVGMYITQISVMKKIGAGWDSIYRIVLDITAVLPCLFNIIRAMNLPVDDALCLLVMRERQAESKKVLAEIRKSSKRNPHYAVDDMPIRLENVFFSLQGNDRATREVLRQVTLNVRGTIEIKQGLLCGVVGPSGGGKSLVVGLISGLYHLHAEGARGLLVVPSHLRILRVSTPYFLNDTLKNNLLFGLPAGDKDGDLKRVVSICTRLGVGELVMKYLDSSDQLQWAEVFSLAEQLALSLARALIANPEVLCLLQPERGMSESRCARFGKALKEFTTERGLDCEGHRLQRRHRTAFVTLTNHHLIDHCDLVYTVSQQHGMQSVVADKSRSFADAMRGSFMLANDEAG